MTTARRIRRSLRACAALGFALLVAAPDAAIAAEAAGKSMDRMSPSELDAFVRQLNESANWRKYRRPGDPADFVPGKPVRVMHGVGASMGRGGMRGAQFRKAGLANRRGSRSGGRSNDAMAQGRNSRNGTSSSSSSRSGLGGSSRSSFGSSSFGSGSSLGGSFNQ